MVVLKDNHKVVLKSLCHCLGSVPQVILLKGEPLAHFVVKWSGSPFLQVWT